MRLKQQLKTSFSLIFFNQLFSYIVILGIFLITSYGYGAEGRGYFTILNSYTLLIGTLFSLGIGKVLPNMVQNFRETEGNTGKLFYNFLVLYTLLAGLALLLTIATIPIASKYYSVPTKYFLAFLFFVPYQLWLQCNSLVYTSFNLFSIFNVLSIIKNAVLLTFTVLFIFVLKLEFVNYLLIYSLFLFAVSLLEIFILVRKIEFDRKICWLTIKKLIKNGFKINLESIAGLTNSSILNLIIAGNVSLATIGNFNFATQLISILNAPSVIFHQYFMNKNAILGGQIYWTQQKKIITFLLIFVLFLVVVSYFSIDIFCSFFGNDFSESSKMFKFLLLGVIPSSFAFMMYSQWLIRGYFLQYSLINILTSIISVSFSYFSFKYLNMSGVMIGYILIYILGLPAHAYLYRYISVKNCI